MTGPVILFGDYDPQQIGNADMELTFKGGSADGMTLTFIPYSPY